MNISVFLCFFLNIIWNNYKEFWKGTNLKERKKKQKHSRQEKEIVNIKSRWKQLFNKAKEAET